MMTNHQDHRNHQRYQRIKHKRVIPSEYIDSSELNPDNAFEVSYITITIILTAHIKFSPNIISPNDSHLQGC